MHEVSTQETHAVSAWKMHIDGFYYNAIINPSNAEATFGQS